MIEIAIGMPAHQNYNYDIAAYSVKWMYCIKQRLRLKLSYAPAHL